MKLSPVPHTLREWRAASLTVLGVALTFGLGACQRDAALGSQEAQSVSVLPAAPVIAVVAPTPALEIEAEGPAQDLQPTAQPTAQPKKTLAPTGPVQEQKPAAQEEPKYSPEDPQDWVERDQIDGVAVKTVRYTYPSGKLRRIHTQAADVIGPLGHHGRDIHLHENGARKQETEWEQGKLKGSYQQWFEGGQIQVRSTHTNGKRDGLFEEWGEGGTLRVRGEYSAGRLHGEFRQWFGSGANQEVSHWDQGVQTGLFRLWNKGNIPIKSEHYSEGLLHGQAQTFHPVPDEERVHTTGEYRLGVQEGLWLEYDLEGQIANKKTFIDGALQGSYEEWKAGVMVLRTQYKQGLEEGERTEFYLSGQPFAAGAMKSGLREGPWKYWQEDGSLQEKWSGVYQAGKKVSDLPSDRKPDALPPQEESDEE